MTISNLEAIADSLKDVPGDCAEFGCFQGECTIQIARTFGRRTWAWDTFSGMPDDGYIQELDENNPPGKWTPDNNPMLEFRKSGLDIVPIVGKFSDTIPRFKEPTQFAFVHIDCDHYESYRRVLEFLKPRMSPGGLIRIDDYGDCAGCRKAVDEWVEQNGKILDDRQWIRF